jgi:ABC-type microcin C transport system permease subunit YejB
MHWFILKRLLIVPILLFIFSIISFVLIQAPPGDFLTSYIAELTQGGSSVDQAQIDALRPPTASTGRWWSSTSPGSAASCAATSASRSSGTGRTRS